MRQQLQSLAFVFILILAGCDLDSSDGGSDFGPADSALMPGAIREMSDTTVRLAAGRYAMAEQIRFDADSNLILEGSGSGMGAGATILDFSLYSASVSDARALSVRGRVTVKDLTIINVGNRAADLRTGKVDNPSKDPVTFSNVWFIDCKAGLKTTGGRTVGTADMPMVVKKCVFAITSDYPFPETDTPIDFRDTTYAAFDHCDFIGDKGLIKFQLDDPDDAPNTGPVVTIINSILVALNGSGEKVLDIDAGNLTLQSSVLWDFSSNGDINRSGDGSISESSTVVGDPLYFNAASDTGAANLNVNLRPGSPAMGLGTDKRDAGSVAIHADAIGR
jgi:hypothetical protein